MNMRKRTMTLACAAIAGLTVGSAVWAEEPAARFERYKAGKRVIYCARAMSPITLDGDLREWPATDTLRLNVEMRSSPLHHGVLSGAEDMDVHVVTAWTDETFYFGARVVDDVHQTEGYEPHKAFQVDGLSPYFDLDHDENDAGGFHSGDQNWWITAEPERVPGTLWWREGKEGGYRYEEGVEPAEGFEYAVKVTGGGYVMEVAIPMDERGLASNTDRWAPPFLGRTIGFMVVAVDKDDSRNMPFREMVRLSEEEGTFDWGEVAWCGSDDRQSGWGNLVFIDAYDREVHHTPDWYLK